MYRMQRPSQQFTIIAMWGALLLTCPALCQNSTEHVPAAQQLLVRYRPEATTRNDIVLDNALSAAVVSGLHVMQVPPGRNAAQMLRELRSRPDVFYAEPNYVRRVTGTLPNDPQIAQQWNLGGSSNTGVDAGIHAVDAWSITTGRADIVVGIVDTGIDHAHPDLSANVYWNAMDCDGDGRDTDANGFIDDCFGANAITHAGSAIDDNGHGTVMAGIIGATGNNGIGVAGVNWNVKLLPCKALDANGVGTDADIIACFDYLALMKDRGANIVAICAAFGGPDKSQALEDAIAALRSRGVLLVTAAGNDGADNSLVPTYPANYTLANVIAVAASNSSGTLSPFSNFGSTTVHLVAPGELILTTGVNGTYVHTSGTSAAAAHVAGMAALIRASLPAENWTQVRNRLLVGGDSSAEAAATISGRHANVLGSIMCSGGELFAPVSPATARAITTVARGVLFSAYHLDCSGPAGAPDVEISPGNIRVSLRDDGTAPDDVAADGRYSALWTPAAPGVYSFRFSNGYAGTIYVSPYESTEETSSSREFDERNAALLSQTSTIALPFPVSFAGRAYSRVVFDSRGFLSFDPSTKIETHEPLPTSRAQTLIAPWWSEFVVRSATSMRWATIGVAPDRELVFEWSDMAPQECSPAEGARFQTVFFEDSADILFSYANTELGGDCAGNDLGASATVGMQLDRDLGITYAHNAPQLSNGLTIRWRANLPDNASPAVSGVQPGSWAVDNSPVAVVLRGSGFTPGSMVLWNGTPRITTYLAENELYVLASASDLAAPATYNLEVFNALPGGGTSSVAPFIVRAPDFTIQASSQNVSVKSADSSVMTLTVEPAPVFRSEITFTCSGLPAGISCKFAPSTVVPGTTPAVVTVNIAIASQGNAQRANIAIRPGRLWVQLGLGLFALFGIAGSRSRKRLVSALVCCVALALISCGGAAGTAPPALAVAPAVSTATVPVVITASGGGLAHTQTVAVTYTK